MSILRQRIVDVGCTSLVSKPKATSAAVAAEISCRVEGQLGASGTARTKIMKKDEESKHQNFATALSSSLAICRSTAATQCRSAPIGSYGLVPYRPVHCLN